MCVIGSGVPLKRCIHTGTCVPVDTVAMTETVLVATLVVIVHVSTAEESRLALSVALLFFVAVTVVRLHV